MQRQTIPGWNPVKSIGALTCVWLVLGVPLCGRGYTPDSPEVRAMLDKSIAYLKNPSGLNSIGAGEIGGPALVGLAIYKYHRRYFPMDFSIPEQAQARLGEVLRIARMPEQLAKQNNYSLGLALIFLCEVKPSQHMSEIRQLVATTLEKQQSWGSWGYPSSPTGDTSQIQYPMLGLWSANSIKVPVPRASMERAAAWLIRTQDPSGAWGYQGNDPGTYTRVNQTDIRPSLVAAGIGSLHVAADFLGIKNRQARRKTKKGEKGLPPALIPVPDLEIERGARLETPLPIDRLRQAMRDGNEWFRRNPSVKTSKYQYYYLYGLERYQSFREKVEGTSELEPDWYNAGVELMAGLQSPRGAFARPSYADIGCEEVIATAFGSLFLLRSMQATLDKIMEREGILRGGRGLPSDLTEVRLRGNKIVAPAITGKVEDLITMLEDDEADQIENMLDNPDALSLSGITDESEEYASRLWRILQTGSYKARIVAARTLGRHDDLDNVPILIYALSDPDPRVMRSARDALRLISRKFDGFGLPDEPTQAERDLAIDQWKTWYLSIRPDAVFVQ